METPPAFKVVLKPAKSKRIRAVDTHVARGRRPTSPESLDHTPESLLSGSPSLGTLGQKAQRPAGKRSRLNGPPEAENTRIRPKTIHMISVTKAAMPPTVANGPNAISVNRPRRKPMTAGTRKAKIGRVKLGKVSRAGRKVSMINIAAITPTAETGPVDLLEFSSLSSKHMRPMDVVAEEAIIGARTPLMAAAIASV